MEEPRTDCRGLSRPRGGSVELSDISAISRERYSVATKQGFPEP